MLRTLLYSIVLVATVTAVRSLPAAARGHGRSHPATRHPYVIVLDPGHGGDDVGAADSTQTLVEKQLTLRVADRAAADLRHWGFRVYLTRTRDRDVNVPPRDLNHDGHIDHVDELIARNILANRRHANAFVSVHFDASTDPAMRGTHGYYCPDRPFWRGSRRLADLLTASVAASLRRSGYASPNNGVQTDVADLVPQARADYPWFLVLGPSRPHYVIGTAMPGALIETLYLSSPSDDGALRRASTIRALGDGYANGLRSYFGGHSSK